MNKEDIFSITKVTLVVGQPNTNQILQTYFSRESAKEG